MANLDEKSYKKKYKKYKSKYIKLGGASTNRGNSTRIEQRKQQWAKQNYPPIVLLDPRITMSENKDDSYIHQGIISQTINKQISLGREVATGVSDLFGKSGFEGLPLSQARMDLFSHLLKELDLREGEKKKQYKICNFRMNIYRDAMKGAFYLTGYGDLFEKATTD